MSQEPFEIHSSPNAREFFAKHNLSIAATSYKSNQIFSFGASGDGRLSCFHCLAPHPMAITYDNIKNEVWYAGKNHLVRCCVAPKVYNATSTATGGGKDFTATYVPRILYSVGDQDVHKIIPFTNLTTQEQSAFFLSTKFSTLNVLDTQHPEQNVKCVWKPPFISEIVAEDRCHFNDLEVVNNEPRYACMLCQSDGHDGWRDHRERGGIILDMKDNSVVCDGLSMPHSPRMREGKLWVLESGTGYLGYIEAGKFIRKKFLPGFLRGLFFVDRFAVIGSSVDRHEKRFSGLELGTILEKKKTSAICGIYIVDMADFSIHAKIELKGVQEIYDITHMPGFRSRIAGLNDEEAACYWSVEDTTQRGKVEEEEEEET